mmetsp:Transcript_4402/g.10566  ORF Transcript_4402/g.10566 Transcript_4402/m.10566 type:complete len:362 (+) Transcript_4402:1987-3072(+)
MNVAINPLSTFLAKAIVEEIVTDPASHGMASHYDREITVLFVHSFHSFYRLCEISIPCFETQGCQSPVVWNRIEVFPTNISHFFFKKLGHVCPDNGMRFRHGIVNHPFARFETFIGSNTVSRPFVDHVFVQRNMIEPGGTNVELFFNFLKFDVHFGIFHRALTLSDRSRIAIEVLDIVVKTGSRSIVSDISSTGSSIHCTRAAHNFVAQCAFCQKTGIHPQAAALVLFVVEAGIFHIQTRAAHSWKNKDREFHLGRAFLDCTWYILSQCALCFAALGRSFSFLLILLFLFGNLQFIGDDNSGILSKHPQGSNTFDGSIFPNNLRHVSFAIRRSFVFAKGSEASISGTTASGRVESVTSAAL